METFEKTENLQFALSRSLDMERIGGA